MTENTKNKIELLVITIMLMAIQYTLLAIIGNSWNAFQWTNEIKQGLAICVICISIGALVIYLLIAYES